MWLVNTTLNSYQQAFTCVPLFWTATFIATSLTIYTALTTLSQERMIRH